jgi:thiamine biosynthesis lipoprotein
MTSSSQISDTTFRCMGCDVRVLVEDRRDADAPAATARAFLHRFDRTLTRFDPGSELSELNADPRETAAASLLLRSATTAGLWAAQRSGGLVDPTLLGALEDAGYASSMADRRPVALADALDAAPARRAACPHPREVWRRIVVDDRAATVTRPPGVRIDLGGSGKGLAADAAAALMTSADRFAVDCAGDIAVGGQRGEPYDIDIEHPLTGEIVHHVRLTRGGIATTGLNRRIWLNHDGTYAHHLLDPSTGRPAWTGLVGATALAPSTLEAETLAKAAVLSGPSGGRRLLAEHGGVMFLEDGDAEPINLPRARERVRLQDLEAMIR